MTQGIKCMWMRGGTSKGGYFLADDLPQDKDARDRLLLGIMGSPDPRQIDGMGGGDPLTSKVAVVRKSRRPGVDVDYLFLQVFVDKSVVTDAQNCGNILAGVGPFAIERGLIPANEGETSVTIFMENTGQIAEARVTTQGGLVSYEGRAKIDGVPGRHAALPLLFRDTAGSTCGALLPTGNSVDTVEGVDATLIDNGMPVVVMKAGDLGIFGNEDPRVLEADQALRAKLEAIRAEAGRMMNLGDVTRKSVPKLTMVSPPRAGGALATRTFIPHKCHDAIGVLGAVSVATAALLKSGPAAEVAHLPKGDRREISVEHPSGEMTVIAKIEGDEVVSTGILRTARKLMDGFVFPA